MDAPDVPSAGEWRESLKNMCSKFMKAVNFRRISHANSKEYYEQCDRKLICACIIFGIGSVAGNMLLLSQYKNIGSGCSLTIAATTVMYSILTNIQNSSCGPAHSMTMHRKAEVELKKFHCDVNRWICVHLPKSDHETACKDYLMLIDRQKQIHLRIIMDENWATTV